MIGTPPARLAGRFGLSYLSLMLKPAHQGPLPRSAMTAQRPRGTAFLAIAAGATVFGALLIAAVVLWIRYGTAVFFEMIASGLAACF